MRIESPRSFLPERAPPISRICDETREEIRRADHDADRELWGELFVPADPLSRDRELFLYLTP